MLKRARINPVSKTRRQRSGKEGHCGIVRLYGRDMSRLRMAAFERSGGFCEMQRDGKRCMEAIAWSNSELAHIIGHGAGGSDVLDNVLMSCKWRRDRQPGCHALSHNAGGRPCSTSA